MFLHLGQQKWEKAENPGQGRWAERLEFSTQPARWDKASTTGSLEPNYLDKHRLREQRADCQFQEQDTGTKLKEFYTSPSETQQKSPPPSSEERTEDALCHLGRGEEGANTDDLMPKEDRTPEVYAEHSQVACAPPPFLAASFADYNLNSSDTLFARTGGAVVGSSLYPISMYPAEEESSTRSQQQQQLEPEPEELPARDRQSVDQGPAPPPPPPPPSPQQPIPQPPPPPPPVQDVPRTPVGKSHASLVFLTPKEKYAKEVSAERKLESVQRRMIFDVEAADVLTTRPAALSPLASAAEGTPKVTCSLPPFTAAATSSPVKAASRIPLTCKILQAKKKMAIQKKHILEHGEVRLTQEQKSRLKPLRKRAIKAAKQTAAAAGEADKSKSSGGVVQSQWHLPPASETAEHKTKRIFNRKDKLLAEHRSRQVPGGQPQGPAGQSQLTTLVVVMPEATSEEGGRSTGSGDEQKSDESTVQTCAFCSAVCTTRKELYRHVKVGINVGTFKTMPNNFKGRFLGRRGIGAYSTRTVHLIFLVP